jgi:uncharacterized protein
VTVQDNPAERRYEILVDDEVAGSVRYQLRDDAIVLIHTEVGDEFEGRGVGSRLAAGTLDDVRARGLRVIVRCPFIRAYIARHPEYADLLEQDVVR